jgi:hypothetical protein
MPRSRKCSQRGRYGLGRIAAARLLASVPDQPKVNIGPKPAHCSLMICTRCRRESAMI